MTKEHDEVVGTANKLRQAKLYNDLSEEYTPEGANLLASRNLTRNGVPMSPEGVGHWAIINRAAELGQMDLAEERAIASAKTNALTDAILGRPTGDPLPTLAAHAEPAQLAQVDDDQDIEEEEEEDLSEGEGPDYGFDNEEDNDEAKADHVRKIQENSDD